MEYDGVILGTGHNALVLQAYLCRCGLSVASVDRASEPGGGLKTIVNPNHPHALHNTHSFYHRAITQMPWYEDLDLAERGARYLEPELNVALICRDGRSLQWWTDLERTVDSFAQFSRRDARALRYWASEFEPIVERILIPEARCAPLEPATREELLRRTELGRRLLGVSALSPLEFVMGEFENDTIRAGLLFFNGLREVDLRLKGFGHSIPALLASRNKAQMCEGGSKRLAEALVGDIRAHGGEVIMGRELNRILVCDGKATGVELAEGEILSARAFVASGLNPQQTFLEYLEDAPEELRAKARRFQYNLLAPLFAVHLTLREPLAYAACAKAPELEKAFMVILGLEGVGQFHEIVAAHEEGRVPPPVSWGSSPTRFDSSQAPAGYHTAFMWEKVPFRLGGNARAWNEVGPEHGRRLVEHWAGYAPNLSGAIVDSFCLSPLDTERVLPNMREGDLLVGSFANGQVGANRPFAGAGAYRTPIGGLYLCGGSTHPGGNITGLCGYNAARVIASDLGLPVWWNPPDATEALQAL